MKIYNRTQLQEWDAYTIQHEPVKSIDLMERASLAFSDWFCTLIPNRTTKVCIFCGSGNNGGDGLAISRILRDRFYDVSVFICHISQQKSPDFLINYNRLVKRGDVKISDIYSNDFLPDINASQVIIDAVFGTGISRPMDGYWADLISHLNRFSEITRVAVDIPSGMPVDGIPEGACFEADFTCSFEVPKLSFFFVENKIYCGDWYVVKIGLSNTYAEKIESDTFFIEKQFISSKIRKRSKFEHKGHFGHSLIIAGSKGKGGAAVLASKACIRSGAGLVTAMVPECLNDILQVSIPEVMTITAGKNELVNMYHKALQYDAVGVGPGIGTSAEVSHTLRAFLQNCQKPLVLDADALNILSAEKKLKAFIPQNCIITPHPKEFERLFGKTKNSIERIALQQKMSQELGIIIVLKGAYTCISTPEGISYFNSTGNPGMATAGSGDVLTGIITSLLGQGYSSVDASVIAVYLHGLAGDLVMNDRGQESLIASDIILKLGEAFKSLTL
ncbi:MAG: NAD(P)H-hydrate dehydratase [Saprospiraceae bacterium]|nr:NAD(P)H-hydrate dehydratase [Saprospiraceae bacterium]